MIEYFTFGVVYAFACVVQPGPFQAYLISQSLTNGWRRTLPIVFAPLISDGPVAMITLFVLSALPVKLLPLLQIAGGVLLLYLAFVAYKTWRNFNLRSVPLTSSPQNVMKAALVNLLNPGPYLGWSLVLAPMLLKGWRETPANGISLLVGFYGTMIAGSMLLIVVFSVARSFGQRVNRASVAVSVVALACFGLYQLWAGVASLERHTARTAVEFSPLTGGVYVHTSYKMTDDNRILRMVSSEH
jgi:threonine/homoserine/homoserine lactone efflux protein